MAQLLIRPALNDHQVIADLLAPPPMPTIRRARPPIAQLVSDAHIAVQRPTLAESANEAGIPFLVDPTTMLLQSDVDPTSTWAKLPFASACAMSLAEIDVEKLVEQVVQFQVDQGATRIIAPYLYVSEPSDPAFAMSIRLLASTAHYLRDNDVPLPLVAILCAATAPVRERRSARHRCWALRRRSRGARRPHAGAVRLAGRRTE